jgi:hypothetical protein
MGVDECRVLFEPAQPVTQTRAGYNGKSLVKIEAGDAWDAQTLFFKTFTYCKFGQWKNGRSVFVSGSLSG